MIPIFPDFKLLELEDKVTIQHFTNKFPLYSDYNFASKYGYNTENLVSFSTLYDNLVVLFTDYITNKPFFSFLGTNKTLETTITLLKAAKERNFVNYLKLIPEVSITEDLKTSPLVKVTEDKDNFDYILSIPDVAKLTSKHYNKKKQVQQFELDYPTKEVKILDLENESIRNEIITVTSDWQKEKGISDDDARTEKTAIKRTIENSLFLDIFAIGIYLENKLIGFSIADTYSKTQAQFHFVKATKKYKGIYAALYVYLARKLEKMKYAYMNIEEDLGIEGLRQAKQQWHPCDYLKKYIITLTTD